MTGVLARLRAVPWYGWLVVVAVAGLGVMIVHRHYQDDQDRNWLDPHQPPINLDLVVGTVRDAHAAVAAKPVRAPKLYPAPNLAAWCDSWIGDC